MAKAVTVCYHLRVSSTNQKLRIVIACGGTGGHVFPGIATGRELQRRGHGVTLWLSGRRNVEQATLRDWDGPVFQTGARPLGLKSLPAFVATLWRVSRELRRARPHVLLAMGCYSSVPPVLACRWLGIPVALHEANAVPGKAVAFLSRFARATALSFAASARELPGRRTVCTGMPVREGLVDQPPLEGFAPGVADAEAGVPPVGTSKLGGRAASPAAGVFRLLVTGGSLGAHAVNELVCAALMKLREAGGPALRVLHQCGPADEADLRRRYAEAGVDAQAHAFLHGMGRAYASADLVVARAGAATCAELCLCGVPAILIPLPTAVRDHQRLNAEAMVRAGGALLRLQTDLTAETLAADILALAADPARRERMRQALKGLAAPDATGKLADLVEQCARA